MLAGKMFFKLWHSFLNCNDNVTVQAEVKPVLAFWTAFGKLFKYVRAFSWEEKKVWKESIIFDYSSLDILDYSYLDIPKLWPLQFYLRLITVRSGLKNWFQQWRVPLLKIWMACIEMKSRCFYSWVYLFCPFLCLDGYTSEEFFKLIEWMLNII